MSPSLWRRLTGRGEAPQKTVAAPTEEEQAKEQEAVQKAIAEAVSAALNTEDFTKAVAGHLATQLQPSLKAALDISAVETKLLESNAELSKRVDESDKQTTTKLSDLSTLLDTNNTASTSKISSIEAAVAHITETLAELGSSVKALQETILSPDTSLLTSHGEKLDTIADGLKTLQEKGPAPVGLALSSQATKLDAINAELAVIKENAETAASLKSITSELTSLKADLEIGASTGFSGLATQIGNVITAIESQNTTLAEIKAADVGSDILAGVKASNDSHTAHAAALAELKASHEASNAAQTETLTELKSIVATPAPVPEKVDLTPLAATLDEHTAPLTELKSIVSTPPPASEKVDLTPLVSTLDAHTVELAEIKSAVNAPAPAAEKVDLSPLVSTLDAHTAHLTEIKSAVSTPAPVPEKVDLSTLEGSVKEIISTLDSQTATLAEVKDSSSKVEVLAGIDALKTELAESKTTLGKDDTEILVEVKSVKALIEALPAPVAAPEDKSGEILIEVKEVKALVEKAAAVKVEEVGENDKGVEVEPKKLEGNGVKPEEAEVAAEA